MLTLACSERCDSPSRRPDRRQRHGPNLLYARNPIRRLSAFRCGETGAGRNRHPISSALHHNRQGGSEPPAARIYRRQGTAEASVRFIINSAQDPAVFAIPPNNSNWQAPISEATFL